MDGERCPETRLDTLFGWTDPRNQFDKGANREEEVQGQGQEGLLMATEEGIRSPERHEMFGRLFAQVSLMNFETKARADYLTDSDQRHVEGEIIGLADTPGLIQRLIRRLARDWFERGCLKTRPLKNLAEFGGMGFCFKAVVNEDGDVLEVIRQ